MKIDVGSAGNLEGYNPYPIELANEVAYDDAYNAISYVILEKAWTAEKPHWDGFYWAKRTTVPTIIRVMGDTAVFVGSDSVMLVSELDDDLLFFGPIQPPE